MNQLPRILLASISAILCIQLLDAAHQFLVIETFGDIVRYLGITAVAIALLVPVFGAFGWQRAKVLHENLLEFATKRIDDHFAARPILWNVTFAALALFLEMCLIRWTFPRWIANYRNLVLLGCFLGLGIGFITGRRRPAFVPYLLPMIGLQYLQLRLMIEIDQLSAGLPSFLPNFISEIFISPQWQFLLVALAAVAPGQLVGALLAKRSDLSGYGANLLGSVVGILIAYFLAAIWTSPPVWMALVTLVVLWAFPKSSTIFAALMLAVLLQLSNMASPPEELVVYSPYQRLALRNKGFGHEISDGRVGMTANNSYYQSFPAIDSRRIRPELDVQHRIPNADLAPVWRQLAGAKVLALGSGTGANVTQLLRAGVASVVAVDIDPTIVYFGKKLNADQPYQDPRVTVVVDDARAYLRRTTEKFDFIFFYWIDSHPGSSNAAGFRLDSFVYTRECFEQCKNHLANGGRLMLYAWMGPFSRLKIFHTMKEVFGPNIHTYRIPPWESQWLYAVGSGFEMQTGPYVNSSALPDASSAPILTDDFPFLYLGDPATSSGKLLRFTVFVVIVSLIGLRLSSSKERKQSKHGRMLLVFFLFGVAFLLLETVLIMQVALLFGNTWTVVGQVVIAILLMAFAGNFMVQRRWLPFQPVLYAIGLFITLLLIWRFRANDVVAAFGNGSLASILYITLASFPVFFSSVLFSMLLDGFPEVDVALGSNLLGAMVGGCLEYSAMIVGYKALTLLIPITYLLAIILYARDWRNYSARPGSR
jgi:hypothetical protein